MGNLAIIRFFPRHFLPVYFLILPAYSADLFCLLILPAYSDSRLSAIMWHRRHILTDIAVWYIVFSLPANSPVLSLDKNLIKSREKSKNC